MSASVKKPSRWLNVVAGLTVAVAAAAGVGRNVAATPAATRCVQIVRVSSGPNI